MANLGQAKAAEIKPVQIYSSTKVDGSQYNVTLKWKNVSENQTSIDPDSGYLLYDIYKDGKKIKSVQEDLVNDNIFTDTMSQTEAQNTHTYYVIVNITRPAAQSVPSNTVTITKDSFTNPDNNNPPETGTIPAPRVVGAISGSAITLKWDRTTYSGCDPDSGQIFYRIYRDKKQINATQVTAYTGSYTDSLNEEDAKTTHAYYVTTYCTRTADTTGGKESAPSNIIQYNPADGTNPPSITNPDGVVYTDPDINPKTGDTDTCTPKCEAGWLASHFTISGAIQNAVCAMQCALINWESEIIVWFVNHLLMPALGLGSQ